MHWFEWLGNDIAGETRRRRRVRVLALSAIAGAAALGCAAQATYATASDDSKPAHVRWAERLVAELTPDRNAYAWNPTYVVWNEDHDGAARNRSVCSSFVSRVLERAYGLDRSNLLERFGTANPQAKDYYATIFAERGFERIARLEDARAGDIIAVRYPPGSHPTGHVMIVDGVAHARSSTEPIVARTTQYEVAVIDSSHSFHGLRDTRYQRKHEPSDRAGVGRGTLRLYAGTDGRIAGYTWSTRPVSKYYDSAERQLVVGRFQPAYAGPRASSVDSRTYDDREDSDFTRE